jgi:hypothetical protein
LPPPTNLSQSAIVTAVKRLYNSKLCTGKSLPTPSSTRRTTV